MLKPQIWNMKFMSQILSNPSNAHLCHDNGGLHNESLSVSLSLSVSVSVSLFCLSLCVCLWSASDFWVPNLLPEIVELLDWGEVAASNPIFFSCSSWTSSSSSSSSVHIGLFCFLINELSSTLQNSQHSQQPQVHNQKFFFTRHRNFHSAALWILFPFLQWYVSIDRPWLVSMHGISLWLLLLLLCTCVLFPDHVVFFFASGPFESHATPCHVCPDNAVAICENCSSAITITILQHVM